MANSSYIVTHWKKNNLRGAEFWSPDLQLRRHRYYHPCVAAEYNYGWHRTFHKAQHRLYQKKLMKMGGQIIPQMYLKTYRNNFLSNKLISSDEKRNPKMLALKLEYFLHLHTELVF